MLPELAEAEARGQVADIYAEIRALCGVPYVSSMQRHLATRPGWLEWAWAQVAPMFRDGRAQEAAWAAAATLDAEALDPLSEGAAAVLGVQGQDVSVVRDLCLGFARVSPTNLAFSGLLRALLAVSDAGAVRRPAASMPDAASSVPAWKAPPPLPVPPPLVDTDTLTPELLAVLRTFEVQVDGAPFIPGLYRMLAHWPALLAHLAVVLGPRLHSAAFDTVCGQLAVAVDDAVAPLAGELATRHCPPPPPGREAVLDAVARYRQTSPQMVLFGRMIANALPHPGAAEAGA